MMMTDADELKVSVVGGADRWEVLLEVNGKEWKRYGPWTDRDTAGLYAAEALRRAGELAGNLWSRQ